MPTALIVLIVALGGQSPLTCATVEDCRSQAEAAAAQGDYERFHDLAWRAAQKGKPNDPALMYLLARAMSLSGRPGDAYVMLSRLADLGAPADAATNDDFRRVRAMKTWPELEAKLAAVATPPSPAPAATASTPASPGRSRGRGASRIARPGAPVATPAPSGTAPPAPPAGAPEPTVRPAPPSASEAAASPAAGRSIEFDAAPLSPVGLAYDAVSRRFLIGDRAGDRLIVIDEGSHNVANLVHAAAGGFRDDLTAFDIDRRRGDLWVVSASGEGEAAVSTVHKLQLISGRSLLDIQPSGFGPIRFADVAAATDGTVWLLDTAGSRLFRVKAGSRAVELAAKLGVEGVVSFALADGDTAYVASDAGLLRIDLATRALTRVKTTAALARLVSIRWYRGSLIAIAHGSPKARLLRLKLDSLGTAIASTSVIAADLPSETAATIAGDTLYYLARPRVIASIQLNK